MPRVSCPVFSEADEEDVHELAFEYNLLTRFIGWTLCMRGETAGKFAPQRPKPISIIARNVGFRVTNTGDGIAG